MNAGRRSTVIAFERRTLPLNADDQPVETWVPAFTQWSEALRQSETLARFTIPYTADIRPETYRIIWEGQIWPITSAIHDQANSVTICDCDFSIMVDATHLGSTEREFITGTQPLVRPEE